MKEDKLKDIIRQSLERLEKAGYELDKVDKNMIVEYTKQFLDLMHIEDEPAPDTGKDSEESSPDKSESGEEEEKPTDSKSKPKSVEDALEEVLDEMKKEKEESSKPEPSEEEREGEPSEPEEDYGKGIDPREPIKIPEREEGSKKVDEMFDKVQDRIKAEQSFENIDLSGFAFFTQKMKSVMKDNMFDREVGGTRSGKLDMKKLYKVEAHSTRVFKKKSERQNKKYNILLVLDTSGSMSNSMRTTDKKYEPRIVVEAKLATILIMALQKNNIDFEVITFNGRLVNLKNYKEKLRVDQAREFAMLVYNEFRTGPTGCNHDLDAIREANKIQYRQTEGKNITVFMSDGGLYDCGCYERSFSGDSYKNIIKTELNALRKVSDIISVGIGTREVENWYYNTTSVFTEQEFMQAIIGKLNKIITRG